MNGSEWYSAREVGQLGYIDCSQVYINLTQKPTFVAGVESLKYPELTLKGNHLVILCSGQSFTQRTEGA